MPIKKDYLEILSSVNTTNISDAMDKLRLQGVLEGIFAINDPPQRVFGRVVTVQLTNKLLGRPSHLGVRVIEQTSPGNIIIMANEGRTEMACWGGILSTAAKVKGIASVIIDGACRDLEEINQLDFPVFAKAVSPKSARNRVYQGSINQPIMIGGVEVQPNDIVVADENGVIAIPQKYEASILSEALKIYQIENEMIENIKAGKSILEVDSDDKYHDRLKLSDME